MTNVVELQQIPKLRRQAIEFLRLVRPHAAGFAAGHHVLEKLEERTRESFALPPGGLLFDTDSDFEVPFADMRLPFSAVALEFTYAPGTLTGVTSTITAAVLLLTGGAGAGDALEVQPVFATSKGGVGGWVPLPAKLLLAEPSRMTIKNGITRVEGARVGYPDRGEWLESVYGRDGRDRETVAPELAKLLVMCVAPVAQFCAFAGCANTIPIKAIRVGELARQRAEEKRRAPVNDYWILDVYTDRKPASGAAGAGQHESPRMHVRRGHVRRLPSGGTTWVRSCVVGSEDRGAVVKDYRVRT